MSHTGNEYEMRTVLDFARVPPERRAACLEEFGTFLALHDAVTVMAANVGATPADMGLIDKFIWIDDGKRDVTVRVHVKEEKS